MDFARLMASMDEDDGPGLTDMQIVARLEDAYAKLSAPVERFEPGQIVQHRLGKSADVRAGAAPVVFMGYLDEPITARGAISDVRDFGSNNAAKIFDCTIGRVQKDGDETFSVHFAESKTLKPYVATGE